MATVTEISSASEHGRRRRQTHLVSFGLSPEQWDSLLALANEEVRDPVQQARYIVLQAIRDYEGERAS